MDAANGATSAVASAVFRALGAEVRSISDQPDGCNINNGCGSTHMGQLQHQVVAEVGADLGLAFDGDADRMLAVDETGQVVDGDQIIAMIAAWLRDRDELDTNSVVITQMSNMGLTPGHGAFGRSRRRNKGWGSLCVGANAPDWCGSWWRTVRPYYP